MSTNDQHSLFSLKNRDADMQSLGWMFAFFVLLEDFAARTEQVDLVLGAIKRGKDKVWMIVKKLLSLINKKKYVIMWLDLIKFSFDVIKEIVNIKKESRIEIARKQFENEVFERVKKYDNKIKDLEQKITHLLQYINDLEDPTFIVNSNKIIIEKPNHVSTNLFFSNIQDKVESRMGQKSTPLPFKVNIEYVEFWKNVISCIVKVSDLDMKGLRLCIEKRYIKYIEFKAIYSQSQSNKIKIEFFVNTSEVNVYRNRTLVNNSLLPELIGDFNFFARTFCKNNVKWYIGIHEHLNRDLLIAETQIQKHLLKS